MTLVAGALRLPFAVFFAIGALGRFLHFLAVVLVPRLAMDRTAL
jgi:membrane protein YqaA with SNARE-associated domain